MHEGLQDRWNWRVRWKSGTFLLYKLQPITISYIKVPYSLVFIIFSNETIKSVKLSSIFLSSFFLINFFSFTFSFRCHRSIKYTLVSYKVVIWCNSSLVWAHIKMALLCVDCMSMQFAIHNLRFISKWLFVCIAGIIFEQYRKAYIGYSGK